LVRKFLIAFFAALSAHILVLQPVSAQAPRPVGASGPAYRINAGDEIEVMVWGDDRLQRVVRVLPDGTFSFPLVGQVVAAGQLPSDLSA
jgi:polysaccharide export outer membrane protein